MSVKPWSVWIGFDPHQAAAFAVARQSIRFYNQHCRIHGVVLSDVQDRGLYYRPTERRLGKLWDVISDAPMSTEFAISRFLIPELDKRLVPEHCRKDPGGWALFMDCDVLVRTSLLQLFLGLDDTKAAYCVKHAHVPDKTVKMDGQTQTTYSRKNWSSVMALNLDHPSNKALSVELVNTWPGRDLHAFKWLKDDEIGELSPAWNYLVGHTKLNVEPKIVHFTDGGPWFEAFKDVEYGAEWMVELERWAR
jgi:hypothetical protein